MKGKGVAKNFVYNTLYQMLILITPLITMPYVSRVLGADGIGVYSYTQSIATYFMLLGAAGTTLYGQREIAYVQLNPLKRTEVFWEIMIIRFSTVLICTSLYYSIFAINGQYAGIHRILVFEVFATAFDVSWFFMGMENFKTTVIRGTIVKLLGIVLIFVLVKSPKDIGIYTACVTLPIFIGNISMWIGLKRYLVKSKKISLYRIKAHIKPMLILFIPQIAIEIYTVLDKTMIGIWGTNIEQVGYYTQAQRIVKMVLLIITSLGTVMLPTMSAAYAQGRHIEIVNSIIMALKFVFMIGFPLFFGLIAISDRFVPLFFGEGYDLVIPLIIVISPILILIGISNMIGKQFLLPTKQQGVFTKSIVVGACTNCIFNVILINFYDAIGASIATIIAEMAVTVIQMYYVREQLPLRKCINPFIRYMIQGFIMFIIVCNVGKILPEGILSLGIMILIGMVTYFLELIITKDELIRYGCKIIKNKR